jgi:hypothetical protein
MGIWRVLSGDIICDKCEKHLARIEFDAADQVNIERIHVLCDDCVALKDTHTGEE